MSVRWKYFRDIAVAVILFTATILRRGIMLASLGKRTLGILSDGFFSAGMLLFGVGVISFAARCGTFDMLFYCVGGLIGDTRGDFFEYKCQHRAKSSYYGSVIIGGVCLITSILMLALYLAV